MKAALAYDGKVIIDEGDVALTHRAGGVIWRGEFISPAVDKLTVGNTYRLLFSEAAFLDVTIIQIKHGGRAVFESASRSHTIQL